ncbi:ATP-binding protein [Actimicrobium antarcticum]|uniref:histidine kinase n=1 Tax=Actimicrobium antarcticum TaxID=1051899 RepID=A0ABP7SZY3_9BURK
MNSIRSRLSVFLLLAAMLTALGTGVVTYRQTLAENEELFDYQLRQIALSLRNQGLVVNSYADSNDETLEVVVQIWTVSGTMLYLSNPGDPIFDRATIGFTDVNANNRRWRVFSLAARDRIIQVAQPLELRRDLAATAALRGLAPLLAFAPLMALLIWWLVGSSLSPLKRLATEVGQRDARILDEVSVAGLPDEIAPLVQALNSLLIRLKRAFANQRAFVADAAHELRSPLTALKLQLQLLARAPDDAAKADALAKLHEGVDRATHLIEQLLVAAQTAPNDTVAQLESTDLSELVRQSIADVFSLAQTRRITLEANAPEHLQLSIDPARIRILVRNLLDNAIRYGRDDGSVHVQLSNDHDRVLLVIEDDGPGIDAHDRERIFDRFYRGPAQQQSGSGLGLSIVKNIVEQHGARIELEPSRLGGLKVTIFFAHRTSESDFRK